MRERIVWIRGGRIVDPATGRDEEGDVVVRGERIEEVGRVTPPRRDVEADVVDATGLLVAPGLIDMHAHLREPGNEEEETIQSGAQAAVSGGITSVAAFPNTEPAIDNEGAAEFVVLQGKRAELANIFPVGAVTLGRDGKQLSEMGGLVRAGAVAFSEGDRSLRSAEVMRRGLLYAKMFDRAVIAHCEDPDLRGAGVMNYGKVSLRLGLSGIPAAAEDIVIARDIRLAEITQGQLHIGHMSTEDGVAQLSAAKERGLDVTGEVTPPHFTLTQDSVLGYDPNFKLIPPLRTKADREALIRGLEEGVIDVVASGHAPHSPEEKSVEFQNAPPGAVGLETLFAVSYSVLCEERGFSLLKLLEKMTINPARILRLDKVRGSLEPGKLADIAIFDLSRERIVQPARFRSKSRNTCFEGRAVRGEAIHVFVSGRWVLKSGELAPAATRGGSL
jgi:dihydroorotase